MLPSVDRHEKIGKHFARKGFGHLRPAAQFLTGLHRGAFSLRRYHVFASRHPLLDLWRLRRARTRLPRRCDDRNRGVAWRLLNRDRAGLRRSRRFERALHRARSENASRGRMPARDRYSDVASAQRRHSRHREARRTPLVRLPLRRLRGESERDLYGYLPEPAPTPALRAYAPGLRTTCLSDRSELYLGLGDEPAP